MGFQFYEVPDAVDTNNTENTENKASVEDMEFVAEDAFYIYEPNGDMRAGTLDDYLQSYSVESSGKKDIGYIYQEGNSSFTVENYKKRIQDKTYQWTSVPVKANTASGYTLIKVGNEEVTDLEASQTIEIDASEEVTLIRQGTSAWDHDKLKNKLKLNNTYDSRDIARIGVFEEPTPIMSTVKVDEIKKIRIYFWIEGQDIDCWNHMAGGNIFANLEFTGEATN